jgi:hypothetical protein
LRELRHGSLNVRLQISWSFVGYLQGVLGDRLWENLHSRSQCWWWLRGQEASKVGMTIVILYLLEVSLKDLHPILHEMDISK